MAASLSGEAAADASDVSVRSPLSYHEEWSTTACPKCGNPKARRDTDTLDTFVDSSWYFMRYPDAACTTLAFQPHVANQWLPVDLYIGGIEHSILHLLYARFIGKFLYKRGLLSEREPIRSLLTQGMVKCKTYRHPVTKRYLRPGEVD